MKYKSFLITLSIATLTACAVDSQDDTQTVANTEPEVVTQGRVRELTGQPPVDLPAIIATAEPVKDESRGDAGKTDILVRPDSSPALYERDVAESISHMSDQRLAAMKHSQVPAGMMQGNNIRRAVEPLYRENYRHFENQSVMRVLDNPVSTFSIDVDSGAYSNMRRWLNQGQLPPEDAVRVEEFINYFNYDYPLPESRNVPFQVSTEIAPTPWNNQTRLLRIGIQGYKVTRDQLPASNLVFLMDVSGSMNSPDKLPLLKQALTMLVGQLDARDSISMVVYAGASGVVLPPTPGNRKADILAALQKLQAGGSTNGAAGIRLAYQMAQQNFISGGVNRVILATDGDFNVGMASTEELIDLIQRKRKAGIALTTLGFGSGNYNDHLLEQLADEGNGNYAYIDRLHEAKKVLAEELSATLLTIAKDVKIQIEFNPARVSEYRLIGYENRMLNEEDFANDKVDAGEIGAGHRVTALYEISLTGSPGQRLPERRYQSEANSTEVHTASFSNELAHLRIRYKMPNETVSKLIQSPVMDSGINARGGDSFNFAAAVAAFGQKLRGGTFLDDFSYADIESLARQSRGKDPHGYRSEFMQLVSLAGTLDQAENIAQNLDEG
ncbi:MAG: VWA domain-containing protein [Gammaproteobacteria bacterium]|nr:VWA domain-containing protein [Gammaproteobacteria bacterium]